MITIISLVLFILVLARFIFFALKEGWGMFETAAYLIYIPAMLLLMIFGGAVYIALALIILAGIFSFILCSRSENRKDVLDMANAK